MSFKENLILWPEFFLNIDCFIPDDEDNLIAALEHPDHVRKITLNMSSKVEKVLRMLQVPFPILTHLDLSGPDDEDEVFDLLDQFLGVAAPSLQDLSLGNISFPALPTLLSASDLVSLRLHSIPPTGYISPEAMARSLVMLTKLKTLRIEFPNPIDSELSPCQHQRLCLPLDSLMPVVLPVLTEFRFHGDSEYLEDLLAQVTMPQVEVVNIEYSKPEIETCQLSQFVNRAESLKLAQFRDATITFDFHNAYIGLYDPQGEHREARFTLTIWDPEMNYPMSSMADVLGQLVTLLSNVSELHIAGEHEKGRASFDPVKGYVNSDAWLPLLRPFIAVEALDVYGGLAEFVSGQFQWYPEDSTDIDILPALKFLCFDDDSNVGDNEEFLSLRERSGRPVDILLRREFDEIMATKRKC